MVTAIALRLYAARLAGDFYRLDAALVKALRDGRPIGEIAAELAGTADRIGKLLASRGGDVRAHGVLVWFAKVLRTGDLARIAEARSASWWAPKYAAEFLAGVGVDRLASGHRKRERGGSLDARAVGAVELFANPEDTHYRPGWTVADVATLLGVAPSSLVGRQRDGTYACPEFQRLRAEHGRGPVGRKRRP